MANKKKYTKKNVNKNIQQKKKTAKKGQSVKHRKHTEIVNKFEGKVWAQPWIEVVVYSAIIVLAAFLLYNRTVDYGLVYCDDNIFVQDYKQYNSDPDNIVNSFKKTLGATYFRPILASSFIIDHQIGGTDPSTYRTTNLIFHAIGSLLLFLTLVKLGYKRFPSFLFGMFFAAHTILAPSASWISGRNDSMITIFILLSFILMIGFFQTSGIKKFLFYFFHIIAYALSLYTKETAAFIPFVFFAYIIFFRKDRPFTTNSISLISGWFIAGVIWFAMRHNATAHIDSPDTIGLDALIKNYPTIFALIGKIFLPIRMHALSNYEPMAIISGIAAIIGMGAGVYFSKKTDNKNILFGALWFMLFLLPTLLVRIIYVGDFFDYAEHRAYLPMLGILIILMEILRANKVNFMKPVPIIISVAIIGALAYNSYKYQPIFRNRTTYWSNSIEVYPYKSRGYLDLGKAYYVREDFDKAEELYHKGIELNPKNFNLYIDLSAVYLRTERYDKAESYAQKALQLDSDNHLAHYNLGKAYILKKNWQKAVKHLEFAVTKNQKHPQWLIDLGMAYFNLKQYQKAINIYNRAIRRNPNIPQAYMNLGVCHAYLKNYQKAEENWLKAVKLQPKFYDAYYNLIKIYMQNREKDKIQRTIQMLRQNDGKLPKKLAQQLRAANLM